MMFTLHRFSVAVGCLIVSLSMSLAQTDSEVVCFTSNMTLSIVPDETSPEMPISGDGWMFHKTVAGQKINWYFYNSNLSPTAPQQYQTVQSQWAVVNFFGYAPNFQGPYFVLYTAKKSSSTASFYDRRAQVTDFVKTASG